MQIEEGVRLERPDQLASAPAYQIDARRVIVEPLQVAGQRSRLDLAANHFRHRYAQRLLDDHEVGLGDAERVHVSRIEFPATGNGGHDVGIVEHCPATGEANDVVLRPGFGDGHSEIENGAVRQDMWMGCVGHDSQVMTDVDFALGFQRFDVDTI